MRTPSIIMLYKNTKKVNDFQGSSFVSPAHGCGGARATIEFNNSPSAKKSGEARKQAGVGVAPLSCSVKRSKAKHFSIPFRTWFQTFNATSWLMTSSGFL